MHKDPLNAARNYVYGNGRVLERHLFNFFFEGGSRGSVLRALNAYRHENALFGFGLEPDKRTSNPQPSDQFIAFEILDSLGANAELYLPTCDALQSLTTDEGGLPFSHTSVVDAPHAPWWECASSQPASINPTGAILASLFRAGVTHPWMLPAEDFCWRAAKQVSADTPHSIQCALSFLSIAPDRSRAESILKQLEPVARSAVSFEPDVTGYVFSPLALAPFPDSPAARYFSRDELQVHLQAMLDSQLDDGGWAMNWPAISPGVEVECRSIVTVRNIRTLSSFGMLPQ